MQGMAQVVVSPAPFPEVALPPVVPGGRIASPRAHAGFAPGLVGLGLPLPRVSEPFPLVSDVAVAQAELTRAHDFKAEALQAELNRAVDELADAHSRLAASSAAQSTLVGEQQTLRMQLGAATEANEKLNDAAMRAGDDARHHQRLCADLEVHLQRRSREYEDAARRASEAESRGAALGVELAVANEALAKMRQQQADSQAEAARAEEGRVLLDAVHRDVTVQKNSLESAVREGQVREHAAASELATARAAHDALQRQYDTLAREHNRAVEEVAGLRERVAVLQGAHDAALVEGAVAKDAHSAARTEKAALDEQLAATHSAKTRAELELGQRMQDIEHAARRLGELAAAHRPALSPMSMATATTPSGFGAARTLEGWVREAEAVVAALAAGAAAAREEGAGAAAELGRAQRREEELAQRYTAVELERNALKERAGALELQVARGEGDRQAVGVQLTAVQADHTAAANDLRSTSAKLAEALANIAALQNQQRASEAATVELRAVHEATTAELRSATSKLASVTADHAGTSAQLVAASERCEELSQKHSALAEDAARIRQGLSEAAARDSETTRQLQHVNAAHAALVQASKETDSRLEEALRVNAELVQETRRLEGECDRLQVELERRGLDAERAGIAAQSAEESLKARLGNVEARLETLRRERDEERAAHDQTLRNTHAEFATRLQAMEAALESAQQAFVEEQKHAEQTYAHAQRVAAAQVSEGEVALRTVAAEKDAATKRAERAEGEVRTRGEELQRVHAEAGDLRVQMTQLRSALDAANERGRRVEALEAELVHAKAEHEDAENEQRELRSCLSKLGQELTVSTADVSALTQVNAALQKDNAQMVDRVDATLADKDRQETSLRRQLEEAKEEANAAAMDNKVLKLKVQSLTHEQQALTQRQQGLREEVAVAEAEVATTKSLAASLRAAEASLLTQTHRVEELENLLLQYGPTMDFMRRGVVGDTVTPHHDVGKMLMEKRVEALSRETEQLQQQLLLVQAERDEARHRAALLSIPQPPPQFP